jgi:hypothetical protein
MNTNDVDDAPFDFDAGSIEIGRYARLSEDGFAIAIDGAVAYSLRLIPSNKVLGRFTSTRKAWPVILDELAGGRPARCLVLDWHDAAGRRGRVGSGRLLAFTAARGVGQAARKPERIAG